MSCKQVCRRTLNILKRWRPVNDSMITLDVNSDDLQGDLRGNLDDLLQTSASIMRSSLYGHRIPAQF